MTIYIWRWNISLRQLARALETPCQRGGRGQLRASDRRGAADRSRRKGRASGFKAFQFDAHQRESTRTIDFGSARTQFVPSDLSQSGDCTGTPYYVCPEQVENRDPDARGDLYSLGIVFFEMLTGALPFSGKTLTEILAAHRLAPLPRLPEQFSAYQPIIDRLLAKDPKDRYASAAEFLDALDALRAELIARKPSKPQRSA